MTDDYLVCPFCGENDFDRIGLANHLYGGTSADCAYYVDAFKEGIEEDKRRWAERKAKG